MCLSTFCLSVNSELKEWWCVSLATAAYIRLQQIALSATLKLTSITICVPYLGKHFPYMLDFIPNFRIIAFHWAAKNFGLSLWTLLSVSWPRCDFKLTSAKLDAENVPPIMGCLHKPLPFLFTHSWSFLSPWEDLKCYTTWLKCAKIRVGTAIWTVPSWDSVLSHVDTRQNKYLRILTWGSWTWKNNSCYITL